MLLATLRVARDAERPGRHSYAERGNEECYQVAQITQIKSFQSAKSLIFSRLISKDFPSNGPKFFDCLV